MKEKRDKKGRKWRLVKPARPVGMYDFSFTPCGVEYCPNWGRELLSWEKRGLSTGKYVIFSLWRNPDRSASFECVASSLLSDEGFQEADKLYKEAYEMWLNRVAVLPDVENFSPGDV